MMGRERGWDGREHSLRRGRESECQGKAGQMGTGGESVPIVHFRTGHSDAMPRVGSLPERVTGPQPKAVEAEPVVPCSCLRGEPGFCCLRRAWEGKH